MDDFLYNVRTGNMRNMDKSNRRYDNNRYKSQNRHQGKERRKGYVNYRSLSTDQFTTLKDVLGTMAEKQERQTVAMEKIAKSLEKLVSISSQPKPSTPPAPIPVSTGTTETAPVSETSATPQTRDEMVAFIHQLRNQKLSYEKIADIFEEKQISTLSGRGKWRGQTIYRLFKEG